MDISLRWINRYLDPGDVSPEELDHVLTEGGFPIETRTDLDSGDIFFDVEITSNRGDCLSHLGLAREIAASRQASKNRTLVPPRVEMPATSGNVADFLTLENRETGVCPRFTAQVIRGVKVGPSPAWLVELLEAIDQRSINNIVDVTNWLTFEYGQPSHVFDLETLAGSRLVIRYANAGETLRTLDGIDRKLVKADLVVADGERAQSLAGVIGGQPTEVSTKTVNVVLEAATWDPVTVRTIARRLNIRTDASHRFERGVDARTILDPAKRAAAMIVELAGGQLASGVLDEGAPPTPPSEATRITLRPSRVHRILGIEVAREECVDLLRGLEIDATASEDDDILACTIPAFRLDLTREIDLIEEVARTKGYDAIPLQERLPITIPHPQESERALREIAGVLTGLGFYETVTISFTSPDRAKPFIGEGLREIGVDDERRGSEPTLRPSVLTGLLACRKANQDGQVHVPGGVRLFERAAAFAQDESGTTVESQKLTLLMDVPGAGAKRSFDDRQTGVRLLVGAIESLVRTVGGPHAELIVSPGAPTRACWDASAFATISLKAKSGEMVSLGEMGQISQSVQQAYGLDVAVLAAEIDLEDFVALYPPKARAEALPSFPSIERDLSIALDEGRMWREVEQTVLGVNAERLERIEFVGTYRGKQVGKGKKSLTFRMRFRDPERTLRHEEVDPQVDAIVSALRSALGGELRA